MISAIQKMADNRPTAPTDSLIASVLLAFLTTAGLFYVNIMPALVSGLVEGIGISQKTAGYVASANVYGASVGALIIVFVVKYIRWKFAALLSLGGLISLDVISMFQDNGDILIPLRFAHGMTGGFLVGIGFSVIARTKVPDSSFGMLLVVQYGLGGVGLMTLPRLVPIYGTEVLFIALIAFSVVTLCMLPFLGAYPPKEKQETSGDVSVNTVMFKYLILGLLAVFCFQAANMGLAAYIIELGKHNGLTTGNVSTTLGIANWIAVTGAIAVYVLGLKNGRVKPLMAGLVMTIIGMALFYYSANSLMFFAANMVTGITWAFIIPYLLGMCSAFDETGQMAALSGFFSKMGLASGPFVAAMMIGDGNFNLLINAAIIGILLCAACAFIPARHLDGAATKDD